MRFINIIFIFLLFFAPANLFAKAGPAIPAPKLSIIEAASIASEYFYHKETRVRGEDYFKKADYILISAVYTNRFKETPEEEWGWKIMFIHPVQNDHSVVYKVADNREVIFLYGSE